MFKKYNGKILQNRKYVNDIEMEIIGMFVFYLQKMISHYSSPLNKICEDKMTLVKLL